MRVLRLIFIGLFCFVLLTSVSGAYLIQRPDVWEFALKKILSKQKGLILKDIRIGHCAVNFDAVYLSDVRARLELNGHDYDLTNVDIQIFLKDKNGTIDGSLAIIDTYQFNNFKGFVEVKDNVFYLNNFHAAFANGVLNSQARYDLKNKSYFVEMNLKKIDTNVLRESSAVFEQIKANVDGVINLHGDEKGLKDVKGEMSALQGGTLKAKALEYLVDYMPQKTMIKDLINRNADVPLNSATLTISSISMEKVRLHVKILSLPMSLDLNLDIDINCDGGLEAGLQAVQKALKGS